MRDFLSEFGNRVFLFVGFRGRGFFQWEFWHVGFCRYLNIIVINAYIRLAVYALGLEMFLILHNTMDSKLFRVIRLEGMHVYIPVYFIVDNKYRF